MTVRVRLFAAVREAAGVDEVEVAPATVREVLSELRHRFGEPFAKRLAVCAVLLDGTAVPRDADVAVPDGAEVALLPPVSGGAVDQSTPRGATPAVEVDSQWTQRRPEVSVARALGSATRGRIYDHLQHHDDGVAVRDVAELFGLHPNVARTHLETLADAGLVEVGLRRRAAGGRPAKLYRALSDAGAVRSEQRSGDDGVALLVEILSALAESSAGGGPADLPVAAAEVAHMEGRRLGALARASGSPPEAFGAGLRAAMAALAAHAPGVRLLRATDDAAQVTAPRGAFATLRERRPQLATAVERGLLSGVAATVVGPVDLAPADAVGDGVVWRLRRATRARQQVRPLAQLDTRDTPRDAAVLQAIRAIADLDVGGILEVLAEGPGSPAVFARWIDRAGHELLAVERVDNVGGRRAIRLLIRRGA